LSKKGWNVDLKHQRHLCPGCVQAQVAARRAEKSGKQTMSKPRADQILPSEESVFAKQLMMELLAKGYDLKARDYVSGWSDKRIAEDCKLSVDFVAKRREEDFGPAAPPRPPALIEAAQKIETLAGMLKTYVEQVESLYGPIINLRTSAKTIAGQIETMKPFIDDAAKTVASSKPAS
jgi:hypothetical protein